LLHKAAAENFHRKEVAGNFLHKLAAGGFRRRVENKEAGHHKPAVVNFLHIEVERRRRMEVERRRIEVAADEWEFVGESHHQKMGYEIGMFALVGDLLDMKVAVSRVVLVGCIVQLQLVDMLGRPKVSKTPNAEKSQSWFEENHLLQQILQMTRPVRVKSSGCHKSKQ